jgi:hypothetical protein
MIRDLLGFSDYRYRLLDSRNLPRERRHLLGPKKTVSDGEVRIRPSRSSRADCETARLGTIISSWTQASFKT